MFSGIVETTGTLAEVKPLAEGLRVRIATALASELAVGDSLAVNGVCLTVILIKDGEVHADIGPETARITTLGGLQRDERVNLERAVPLGARLGGHVVLGHVDGVGTVEQIRPDAGSQWLTISFAADLARYFIRKGSVTVDGVSLTVAGLGATRFDVQIVPFTWRETTLSDRKIGDKVNLECDMIGKYVVRSIELGEPGKA
jgi:riboflavin synthase